MSDRTLRDLERRALESRSADDEAAWLAARLRAGALDGERLALAAYAGSEAARLALGAAAPAPPAPPADWVRGLEPFGVEAVKAFGVFLASAAEPLLELGPDAGPWEDPLQAAAFEAGQAAYRARVIANAAASELTDLAAASFTPWSPGLAAARRAAHAARRDAEAAEAAAERARQAARHAGTFRELQGPLAGQSSGVAPPTPSRARRFRSALERLDEATSGPFRATLAAMTLRDSARDLLAARRDPGAFERVLAQAQRDLAAWALATTS